ncbi:syntaxin-32-like [Bidens hawaiensis]|uniref:syntaxin-32-like n=1 Tax=Bidens hawaiensis TaxID=980011 RepID=UPI00404A6657
MSLQGSWYRDRTPEFTSIVGRLRKYPQPINRSRSMVSSIVEMLRKSQSSRSNAALQIEFNKRASKIGFGINQTSQKLAKLAKLAKRTSEFDAPTMEIQELTAVIKQEITALNAAVADLQLVCNAQNENESISTDTTNYSTTILDNLNNRLMGATKEFKEVLIMLSENLKVHENRRQLLSANASKDFVNPFAHQRPVANKSASTASTSQPLSVNNNSSKSSLLFPRQQPDGVFQPLLQPQKSQSQSQQQQQMVPLLDSYRQGRAEALHKVESIIHELGTIFTRLATIVSQQGEVAIRIDDNMDDTLANVEGAQGQLMRYLNSISSNRWLIIKIFFVLFVYLMIFLFFVA